MLVAPQVELTLRNLRLNRVPWPASGVKSFEKADTRSVLIPVGGTGRMLADTFQLTPVSPDACAGPGEAVRKVTIDESKVKSPWKPTRLAPLLVVGSISEVVTG